MVIHNLLERFPLPRQPSQPVRIGIIGCGGHAIHVHFPSIRLLQQLGWPVDIVALCDINPVNLTLAAQSFPDARTFADADPLIASKLCDGLMLITPSGIAADLCEKSIAAKTTTLVEKPVAPDVQTLARLAKLAQDAKVQVQVAYNRRHQPLLGEFLAEIRKRPLQHVLARFYRIARDEDSFYADTAIHQMDVLRHCFGEIKVLDAATWPPLPTTQLASGMTIHFVNDADVTVNMDIRPSAGRMLETIEAIALKRTVYLSYQQRPVPNDPPELTVYDDGQTKTLFRHTPTGKMDAPTLFMQGFVQQLAAFFRLVSGDEAASICPMEEAVRSRQLYSDVVARLGWHAHGRR